MCRDPEGAANVGFASISRHMARKKVAHFPKAPSTAQGIADAFVSDAVLNKYGMTLADPNKPFYNCTVIEEHLKYTIFSSGSLLAKLAT